MHIDLIPILLFHYSFHLLLAFYLFTNTVTLIQLNQKGSLGSGLRGAAQKKQYHTTKINSVGQHWSNCRLVFTRLVDLCLFKCPRLEITQYFFLGVQTLGLRIFPFLDFKSQNLGDVLQRGGIYKLSNFPQEVSISADFLKNYKKNCSQWQVWTCLWTTPQPQTIDTQQTTLHWYRDET